MPHLDSPGLCGPKTISHILNISVQEAQTACKWREGKGSEPEQLVRALRKAGWQARYVPFQTIHALVYFLHHERPNGRVIVNYWDDMNGGTEGHYAEFLGLDEYGDVMLWNPDNPDKEHMILPREVFWMRFYDFRIDDVSSLLRGGAIYAYKKDA